MSGVHGYEIAAFLLLSAVRSGNWLVIKLGLEGSPPQRFARPSMPAAAAGERILIGVMLVTLREPAVPRPSHPSPETA